MQRTVVLAALTIGVLVTRTVQAQAILGHVHDAITTSPVALANVRLVDAAGAEVAIVASDSAGRFRVRAPRPGRYQLNVSALGYTTFQSDVLQLDNRVELQIALRLSASAIAVEPLRVVGRRRYVNVGRVQEFYSRAEWARKTGFGHNYRREDIERMRPPSVERLINNSLVYVRNGVPVSRTSCELSVFLDGKLMETSQSTWGGLAVDRVVTPEQVEGIEVYRARLDVPPEYLAEAPCGALLIWTRRDGGRRLTWPKIALAAGAIGGLLLIASQ